jgi:hypothetical protein
MDRRKLLGAAAVAVPVIAGAALLREEDLGKGGSYSPTTSNGGYASQAEEASSGDAAVAMNAAPPVVGVQFHGTWDMYWNGTTPNAMFYKHLDVLKAQSIQVIRLDVGWSSGQPTNVAPDPNQWYHKRVSTVIDEVRARGMQIFITVHQSPAWSRPGTGSEVKQYPTDPNAIKPWLTFIASTYGAKLLAIEVWNEPNLVDFTQLTDLATQCAKYVPVLKAAYTAIKAGRSSLPVILAGPSQTDDAFIKGCYTNGAKGYFDILGVHPYQGNQTRPPESTDITGKARMTNMPAIINLMAQNGDGDKPIWWTEFGFSVHSNDSVPAGQVWLYGVPDDQTSASYILRAYNLAWQNYPQVKLAVTYCSYKTQSDAYGHQYGYRIMEADGTVKAQLAGLASMRQTYGSLQKL